MTDNKHDFAWAHGSMAFFHFLQDRPSERFSRFEAYCYMLDKACTHYRPENIEPKWIPAIGDGQFFITKSELAAAWHWHRATVRWFLNKLSEFGHLSVEEHLKGILCTMHHLIIPVSAEVAITYNFDTMAKYAMYSYARGIHTAEQTAAVCGQIERSAIAMLGGTTLSPFCKQQLMEVQRTLLHYALEAVLAHHPGHVSVASELRINSTMVDKRLLELFREQLAGNWADILTLLSERTEVACTAIVQCLFAGRTARAEAWESLAQEVKTLRNTLDENNGGDAESSVDDTPSSTASSSEDNDTAPSDTITSPSRKDTGPDDYSQGTETTTIKH